MQEREREKGKDIPRNFSLSLSWFSQSICISCSSQCWLQKAMCLSLRLRIKKSLFCLQLFSGERNGFPSPSEMGKQKNRTKRRKTKAGVLWISSYGKRKSVWHGAWCMVRIYFLLWCCCWFCVWSSTKISTTTNQHTKNTGFIFGLSRCSKRICERENERESDTLSFCCWGWQQQREAKNSGEKRQKHSAPPFPPLLLHREKMKKNTMRRLSTRAGVVFLMMMCGVGWGWYWRWWLCVCVNAVLLFLGKATWRRKKKESRPLSSFRKEFYLVTR